MSRDVPRRPILSQGVPGVAGRRAREPHRAGCKVRASVSARDSLLPAIGPVRRGRVVCWRLAWMARPCFRARGGAAAITAPAFAAVVERCNRLQRSGHLGMPWPSAQACVECVSATGSGADQRSATAAHEAYIRRRRARQNPAQSCAATPGDLQEPRCVCPPILRPKQDMLDTESALLCWHRRGSGADSVVAASK